MDDKFISLTREALDLLKYMDTNPGLNAISDAALFNSRMRYIDSIITELKLLVGN